MGWGGEEGTGLQDRNILRKCGSHISGIQQETRFEKDVPEMVTKPELDGHRICAFCLDTASSLLYNKNIMF